MKCKENMNSNHLSTSENNGIKFLTSNDKKVYSVGISTAGVAEICMAKKQSDRNVIATTVDTDGAEL